MIVREALQEGCRTLGESGIEAPAVEAGAILCFVKNCDRSFIYAHGEYELNSTEEQMFGELVNLRAKGKPLQYITGFQEFMSLAFEVNPSVLIPRQDTETLVEAVISYVIKTRRMDECAPDGGGCVRILDIGTGSGCIAVSLAHYIKYSCVTAADISEKALQTAMKNAVKNNVADRISFLESDIYSGLDSYRGSFDVIVSNPPYIPSDQIDTLQREVKDHEPVNALDGGDDGLDFYRRIIGGAAEFLKPDGMLALEVGYDQAAAVSKLMETNFCGISINKDLNGIDRVVTGLVKPVLSLEL